MHLLTAIRNIRCAPHGCMAHMYAHHTAIECVYAHTPMATRHACMHATWSQGTYVWTHHTRHACACIPWLQSFKCMHTKHMHVHMILCMHTNTYACKHGTTHAHVCMHTNITDECMTYTWTHVQMHTSTWGIQMHTSTRHVCAHTTRVCMVTSMLQSSLVHKENYEQRGQTDLAYTYTYLCNYMCACVCVCTMTTIMRVCTMTTAMRMCVCVCTLKERTTWPHRYCICARLCQTRQLYTYL